MWGDGDGTCPKKAEKIGPKKLIEKLVEKICPKKLTLKDWPKEFGHRALAHRAVGLRAGVLPNSGPPGLPDQYLPSTPSPQHACGPNKMLSRATKVCICGLPMSALNGPPGAGAVSPEKRSPEKPM